jgi:hypothetical protein
VLEVVLVVMSAALWNLRQHAAGLSRHLVSAACAALIVLQLLVGGSNAVSDGDADFAARDSLERDLAAVRRVPPDKEIQGVGWYSAPEIALYSGRRIGNIVTKTPAELAATSPVYLALDMPAMHVGAGQYWLERYSYRDIARSDTLWLVALDATAPKHPFDPAMVDEKAVLGHVDFHAGDYPYLLGFQRREGDGWHWVSGDAEVLLRYRGEAEFNVDIYLPPMQGYRLKRDVGITVWADACRLGTFRQDESRRERWWLPVRNCPLAAGQLVSMRLTSDNLYATRDNRQLAYIVHALGFADPAPARGQR